MKPYGVLYRMYAADDTLLYVGATANYLQRLDGHRSQSPWFRETVRVELEHFDTRDEAYDAELAAVQIENPKHNLRKGGSGRAPRRTRRRFDVPRFQTLIDEYGLTVEQAADKLGMHHTTLWDLMTGRRVRPDTAHLYAMSRVFNVDPHSFWIIEELAS
jgi:predicted GIY-YIG superfamily endonuclease